MKWTWLSSILFVLCSLLSESSLATEVSYESSCAPLQRYKSDECSGYCLIPEIHPTVALFLTDIASPETEGLRSRFVDELVSAVFKASDSKRPPQIYLSVHVDTWKRLKSSLATSTPPHTQNQRLKSLTWVSAPKGQDSRFLWQRDLFEPVILNQSLHIAYLEANQAPNDDLSASAQSNFKALSKVVQSCQIPQAKTVRLTSQPRTSATSSEPDSKDISGLLGGNIEAYPGGLLVMGDKGLTPNEWSSYLNQFCPMNQARLSLSTEWLEVGHIDEIIRLIPAPAAQTQCSHAVLIASPRKAFHLMRAHPKAPLIQLPEKILTHCQSGSSDCLPTSELGKTCRAINLFGTKTAVKRSASDFKRFSDFTSLEECADLTQHSFFDFAQKSHLLALNQRAQKQIDQIRQKLAKEMARKLPQCGAPRFIEVPVIFANESLLEQDSFALQHMSDKDRHQALKRIQNMVLGLPLSKLNASSLMPNMINGITVHSTYISPHPYNPLFMHALNNSLTGLGQPLEFIDTFNFAHVGKGDLHCVTNSIHTCSRQPQP